MGERGFAASRGSERRGAPPKTAKHPTMPTAHRKMRKFTNITDPADSPSDVLEQASRGGAARSGVLQEVMHRADIRGDDAHRAQEDDNVHKHNLLRCWPAESAGLCYSTSAIIGAGAS